MEYATHPSVENELGARGQSDVLRDLADRLAGPAAVLLSFAPQVTSALEKGDSGSLMIAAEVVERNAEGLAEQIADWQSQAEGPASTLGADDHAADFMGLFVHEVRTPVAIIQGCSATLTRALDLLDRTSLTKMADAISRSAVRLSELIATFRDAEGLSDDPSNLTFEHMRLGAFVSEVVEDLEPLTDPHPVSVLVGEDVDVFADPVRLRQVITNLLGNASKFAPSNSLIRVSVERVEKDVSLSVIDSGPGIAADRREEIFERWARIDRTVPGAGLGLWVSRAIVRAHGGDLTARDAPDGGSCFVATLPASG